MYCCEGIGFRVLQEMNDGRYIAALGTDVFQKAIYARDSIGIGAKAGLLKLSVERATLVGVSTGYNAGTLADCILIGEKAGEGRATDVLTDAQLSNFIAIGVEAMRYARTAQGANLVVGNYAVNGVNYTGVNNTVLGPSAAQALSSGSENTFVGAGSGSITATGNQNTAVGRSAGPSSASFNNTTQIGYNAGCTASDQVTLGNSSVSALRCAVTSITAISDMRDKEKAGDDGLLPFDALAFIRGVAVRWFTWAMRDGSKTTSKPEAGIFAQELKNLQDEHGVDLGLVDMADPDRMEAAPGKLLFPLIEAVQRIADRCDALEMRLAAVEARQARS
jgi:hypothetical protein